MIWNVGRTLKGAKIREEFAPLAALLGEVTFWRFTKGPSTLECGILLVEAAGPVYM
jgi:hypothetical protein